jgi:hypothetical protein
LWQSLGKVPYFGKALKYRRKSVAKGAPVDDITQLHPIITPEKDLNFLKSARFPHQTLFQEIETVRQFEIRRNGM